jgi:hypothetical protein
MQIYNGRKCGEIVLLQCKLKIVNVRHYYYETCAHGCKCAMVQIEGIVAIK